MLKAFNIIIILCVIIFSGCSTEHADIEAVPINSETDSIEDDEKIIIGALINNVFYEGLLDTNLSNNEKLSKNGTTGIEVTVYDDENQLFTTPITISFSASCGTFGSFESAQTNNGIATAVYQDTGCSGDINITASTQVSGETLIASASISIADSDIGSIEFVSATPDKIYLKGSGNVESSTVQFIVKDEFSELLVGKEVTFELSTSIGGLQLNPTTATSNSQGIVQTVVTAGYVPTSVGVKAWIISDEDNRVVSTTSSNLSVNTGIPAQKGFTILVINPASWSGELLSDIIPIDRSEPINITIVARLTDRYQNPVPDGTKVYFTTEGGSIEPYCATEGGRCEVPWVLQNPMPGMEADGITQRVTILAFAVGEENFFDKNGNGMFDGVNEINVEYDLPEAFLDENEDSVCNPNEQFWDFNSDGICNVKNGKYNGPSCVMESEECTKQLVHVRDSVILLIQ